MTVKPNLVRRLLGLRPAKVYEIPHQNWTAPVQAQANSVTFDGPKLEKIANFQRSLGWRNKNIDVSSRLVNLAAAKGRIAKENVSCNFRCTKFPLDFSVTYMPCKKITKNPSGCGRRFMGFDIGI